MIAVEDELIQQAIKSLDGMNVPSILQDRILQHQMHLTRLASALLIGGQSKNSVRQTIETVMDSFKHELIATIEALMEKRHAE